MVTCDINIVLEEHKAFNAFQMTLETTKPNLTRLNQLTHINGLADNMCPFLDVNYLLYFLLFFHTQ